MSGSNLAPYRHVYLPYITNLSLMQIIKKSTQPSQCAMCQICGVSPSHSYSSIVAAYATCWMLVHAYNASPRKPKWTGPHQRRWGENEFIFHSVTWYHKSSVSRILVNTTKLYNIMYTLVATGVILRSLEYTSPLYTYMSKSLNPISPVRRPPIPN